MIRKRSALRATACAAAVGLPLAALPAAAEDMAKPELLAANCFNCHGPNGESLGTVPELAGIPASLLIRNLREFKSDTKIATIMNRIAKGYSDAEIEAIARYIERVNQ